MIPPLHYVKSIHRVNTSAQGSCFHKMTADVRSVELVKWRFCIQIVAISHASKNMYVLILNFGSFLSAILDRMIHHSRLNKRIHFNYCRVPSRSTRHFSGNQVCHSSIHHSNMTGSCLQESTYRISANSFRP